MMIFNEFLQESLLLEVLNSEFTVNHNKDLKNTINNFLQDRIHSGHTAVMSSDHMDKHNLAVVRLKNHRGEIEYHLFNFTGTIGTLPKEKQNVKALLHGLKIIKDDSRHYMERGNKIKLQSATDEQHINYQRLANHMIRDYPNKTVNDVGKQERTDGLGSSNTIMIESEGFNAINWIEKIKEYEKNERMVK